MKTCSTFRRISLYTYLGFILSLILAIFGDEWIPTRDAQLYLVFMLLAFLSLLIIFAITVIRVIEERKWWWLGALILVFLVAAIPLNIYYLWTCGKLDK